MTGAPYTVENFTVTPMKITDIKFQQGDDFLVYHPLDDITGVELAHLLHLFTVAVAQVSSLSAMHYDYPEFIERKGLLRHFRKEAK